MTDRDHPFFKPLYRRVLVTLFCAAWAGWELYNGERLWGYITLGLTAYAAWVFLITWDRGKAKEGAAHAPPPDDSTKDKP